MSRNQILIGVVSVLATFGILFLVYKMTSVPTVVEFPEVNKLAADDHTTWSKDKKIILVEYSDLQCPACKGFHDAIQSLIKTDSEFRDASKKVTLVYRHFPLTTVHQHAQEASYAAEAAGRQGKFFEMTDKLFATQSSWEKVNDPSEIFLQYAKDLKLDLDKFKSDVNSSGVKTRVQKDVTSGLSFKVDSTPSFFLEGKKLQLASFKEFRDLIIEAAKK